jgi:hypothetical protein
MAAGWFVTAASSVSGHEATAGTLQVARYSGSGYDSVLAASKFPTPLAWGPYGTQAEADAEKARLESSLSKGETKGGAAPAPVSGPDVLKGIDAVGHFFTELWDAALWRSLGWLALGVLLLVTGAALWLKKANYLPAAVPVPA